jgi:hypothetical protein
MILIEGTSYTFSQVFELPYETEEILAELGYQYQIAPLTLGQSASPLPAIIPLLRQQMRDRLPNVALSNETARREFYVSPLLFALLDQTKFRLSIEYTVTGNRLRGAIDYVLRGENDVVVIEAKQADMDRGFNQLSAEMIALSEQRPETPNLLYGAVTTGDLWRFATLDRTQRLIVKDIDEYLLPRDLETLFGIILKLMENN